MPFTEVVGNVWARLLARVDYLIGLADGSGIPIAGTFTGTIVFQSGNVAPIITSVTFGATATLATLKGSALASTTKKVTVVVPSGTVYFAVGTATASSCPILTFVEIPGTAATLATLQFYSAATPAGFIIEEG